MKNLKNLFAWLLPLTALGLLFTGCPKPTDPVEPVDPVEDTTEYLEAGDEVTVNVGETVTVHVKGKTTVDAFDCEGLTITHKGDGAFEISAADTMTDASASVNFYDGTDEDEGVEVTVYVYDPYFTLNITLDEAVAAKAAGVSVYYGADSGTYETVEAEYTAQATTAIARLKKALSNDGNWFNGIKITVKDSSDEIIQTELPIDWFQYTDVAFEGLTVKAYTSGSMTLKLEFASTLGATSVKVLYYPADGDSASGTEETVTVTENIAELLLSKDYSSSWGYNAQITVLKEETDITGNVSITSDYSDFGGTCAKSWWGYVEDATCTIKFSDVNQIVLPYINSEFTCTGKQSVVVPASVFADESIESITVTVTNVDFGTSKEWRWLTIYKSVSDWDNIIGKLIDVAYAEDETVEESYSVVLTGENLTDVKENGLVMAGLSGLSCTLSVKDSNSSD